MSGVSFPVTRPIGRALLVGSAACRAQSLAVLQQQGFPCAEVDDPYAAMAELCRRPLAYRALIVSLSSLFAEELSLISTVKRRYPHLEIWLAQTDGRAAALAEATRLGADGLLADDGLHRFAVADEPHEPADEDEPAESSEVPNSVVSVATHASGGYRSDEHSFGSGESPGEPVLSAEELRALLQEQPYRPPSGEE